MYALGFPEQLKQLEQLQFDSDCAWSVGDYRRDRGSQVYFRTDDELRVIPHRHDYRHHGICCASIDLLRFLSADGDHAHRASPSG
jgi:hypothetical protein